MNEEKLPFTGERYRRAATGYTVTLLMMLLFGLSAVMSDGRTLGSCAVIPLVIAFTSFRNREKKAAALRRQIWNETCSRNPGASGQRLQELAAENWRRDLDADLVRKSAEILATAAFCVLLMIWASPDAELRRLCLRLGFPIPRTEPCWTLAVLGLAVLTPLHALIAAVPWAVAKRKTPDFSGLAAETRNDVTDHSETAKPLAVMEVTGDPNSPENREKLLKTICSQREDARGWIWALVLLAVLALFSVVGLFRSGLLAVMNMIFLLCFGNLMLCRLPTAYSLRQSEQILRGLKQGGLRIVGDTLLYRETRTHNPQLGSDAEKGASSIYNVVCLENTGCWTVGRGKSYLYAADPKTSAMLPESGPVYLVYVPELKQPYMLCIPKEVPSSGEETP